MIRIVDSKEISQVADMFIEFLFELKIVQGITILILHRSLKRILLII